MNIFVDVTTIILELVIVALLWKIITSKSTDVFQQKDDELLKLLDRLDKTLKDEITINRSEINNTMKVGRDELNSGLKSFGDSLAVRISEIAKVQKDQLDTFSKQINLLTTATEQKLDKVNETIEQKMRLLQEDNAKKLDQMRETVDEKLHATLEKRFGESFKLVSDRLDLVHKGLGEMQTLALGVGDLKKVLSNIKSRGTWGEAQLGNLLEEILTPDQYDKNVKTKKSSKENVEYAIKLPGDEDTKHVWLPIDAKFPLEDYQKLIEAQDQANGFLVAEMSKALELRVKAEAKDIRDKYLDPPFTTDFGILFVPIESLYAEILRIPGLFELIRREYKVIVTGPTTVQAILNSLQMGFRTLSIQKRSSEVWNVLSAVKAEFGKFGDLLEKTNNKIQEAGNVIDDAIKKTRTIEKKLNKVEALPVPDHKALPLTIDAIEDSVETAD